MARRYLKIGWDEWDGLPWHVRQSYVEGLVEEFTDPDAAEPDGITWDEFQVEQAS
jgi:hypothetical protein